MTNTKQKEWLNEYNSFNSYKGLMYKPQYDAILKGEFLPPIEVNIDPVNTCQLDCIWCNNKAVRRRGDYMPAVHLLDLIKFFKEWGVKAICFAGGGESALHPNLTEALYLCKDLNMPVSLITNGLFRDEEQIKAVAECTRWVGVSVDCASEETYYDLKGKNRFIQVINNIRKLVRLEAREVTYKYLIHPANQNEISEAINLANGIGCHRIHIRPVSFMNYQDKEEKYDIKNIEYQVQRGRDYYESPTFKIFYVQHKFNQDLHRKFNFKHCQATPIMGIFEANGDIMLCIDRKNDNRLCIGKHTNISEIPNIWGGEKHKQVINEIKLTECPKCTFNKYNEQIEAIGKNLFDWEFT
jgi:MoaA/NifB/PqqE/SkfB family radical SAM enzyme